MQHNYNRYHLRSTRSDSNSDSNLSASTSNTTIVEDDFSDNTSMPRLSIRHDDSDSASESV